MTNDLKFRWAEEILSSTLHDTTKLVGLDLWTYTDKSGANAHPGNKRIAERLNKTLRTVKSHMAILRDGGWIVRTAESNNSQDRKWADTYRLQIPPYRVQPALHPIQSSDFVDRVQSGVDRVQSGVDRVQPALHPNKSLHQASNHHSDPEGSGPASQPDAPAFPSDWETNLDALTEWLDELLGLDDQETDKVWHLWEADKQMHPNGIYNVIVKDRRGPLVATSGVINAHR